MSERDKFFIQQNMKLLCRDEICSVYRMKNDTGDGTATVYELFPGILVMYNDFHMETCPSRDFNDGRLLAIHHCKEGRIEWEVGSGNYLYLASGDMMIDNSAVKNQYCSFPLQHYHGITITISVPLALEAISELLAVFSIDLDDMERSFSRNEHPFIMHGNLAFDHIISELYQVSEQIEVEYLRIKVIELLAALKKIDLSTQGETRPYFYKTQVEKVKAIEAFMTAAPEQRYTMEELAQRFNISVSALKQCFKGVYGMAIYTYMRNYRMDMAASLLTQTEKSITEIAGEVGYTNSSKFAEAFRSVKGKTPLEYRKIKI